MINITIGGEDFTTYIVNIPFIDQSCPEWGNVEGMINDTLTLKLPIRFIDFFSAESEIDVIYTENDIILFKGFISQIKYDNKYIEVLCKSETYVLFNRHIRENEIISIYYAKNKYPPEIMKELLELSSLTMNQNNFQTVNDFYQSLGVTFSVTNENWVTSDLLNKLAEVTLSRIFYYNGEFYMEPIFLWDNPPFIKIQDNYWVDYPLIEKWEKYEADYKGTEVKFGEYVSYSIKNERIPEKTVDVSFNTVNGIYTDNITTAQHIVDIYDYYYSQPLYRLNGSLKPRVMKNINKGSFLYWEGRIYSIVNIKNNRHVKREIECIGIDSYLEIIESYKETGGSIIIDMQHDSLDGLTPMGLVTYYHLNNAQWNDLTQGGDGDLYHSHNHNNLADIDTGSDYLHLNETQREQLTTGINADSQHIHALSSITGDLDDITDGTTYKKFSKTLVDIHHTIVNSIDDLSENQLYWVIVASYFTHVPFGAGDFYLENTVRGVYKFQKAWRHSTSERKIRTYDGSSWSDWIVDPSSSNDIINTYSNEIVTPESYLSEYMFTDDTEIETDSPSYGAYWYTLYKPDITSDARWSSPHIPTSENEMFSILFHNINIVDGENNFRVIVYEYDNTLSSLGSTNYDYDAHGNQSYSNVVINHTVGDSDARYIQVKISVAYGDAWSASSRVSFTNPIIRRGPIIKTYPFVISWTGDTSNETIHVDPYNVLTGIDNRIIVFPPEEFLHILFADGFLEENDIVLVQDCRIWDDSVGDYLYLNAPSPEIKASSNYIEMRGAGTWCTDTGGHTNTIKFTITRFIT